MRPDQINTLYAIQQAIKANVPDTAPVYARWIEQEASKTLGSVGDPLIPVPKPIPGGASPECELCYLQWEVWYTIGIAVCLSLGPTEQQACIDTIYEYYCLQLKSCPCGT